MTKITKKPSIDDYDKGLGMGKEEISSSLMEIEEMVEQKLAHTPKTRNREVWRQWRKEANFLINLYNERVGFKAFKNVH